MSCSLINKILPTLLLVSSNIFSLNISGTVKDKSSAPIAGATVILKSNSQKVITSNNGSFNMTIDAIKTFDHLPLDGSIKVIGNALILKASEDKQIELHIYNLHGRIIHKNLIAVKNGINSIDLTCGEHLSGGVYVVLIKDNGINRILTINLVNSQQMPNNRELRQRVREIIDTLTVTATGFSTKTVPVFSNQSKYDIVLSTIDKTSPEIKISGSNPDTVLLNSIYSEPSVSATDNVDGDISAYVEKKGTVNTNEIGKYDIVYTTTDKAGNSATKTLTVYVMAIHKNIIATKFWVGEGESPDNGNIDNIASAWDEKWAVHYGGIDDPNNRNGYYPASFTPKENPFYFALPYNDFNDLGHKSNITQIPWYDEKKWSDSESLCKNRWIKIINKAGKACYVQWEDVGPFLEDDVAYVFGMADPSNTELLKAGLDLSPAAEDYLDLQGQDTVTWFFVDETDVPDGPWKEIITTSDPFWQ